MKIDRKALDMLLAQQEMTLTELANRSGMGRHQMYTLLRNGSCRPITAGRIARGLGVDVSEIIKQEEEEQKR